jgi:fused signal recognition particle receptor
MAMFKKWFSRKEEAGAEAEKPEAPPDSEAAGEAPEAAGAAAEPPAAERRSAWAMLKSGLSRTRAGLKSIFTFRRQLDEEFVEALEAELYAADFGPEAVQQLIHGEDGVRPAWKEKRIESIEQVRGFLKSRLRELLYRRDHRAIVAPSKPTVILVAGVNGTGKTTTIAKLARKLKDEGHSVMLAAGDTFRAAAVEQLSVWARRLEIDIEIGPQGADPASVAFRSAQKALENGIDFLIVDTAGRLHTQQNLMRELGKIRDVLAKKIPGAPHESLLVLDATTGQNALNQARSFQAAIQVTGIVLSKLDGTAKGGIVVTINNLLEIPVKYVGVGEKLTDLESFDPERFVEALLSA